MFRARTLVLATCLLSTVAALAAQGPSFSCDNAEGVALKVCQSPQLSKLDRDLAALYKRTLGQADSDTQKQLKATQRGWIKGRDECWKASDVDACILEQYQVRMVKLHIQSGAVQVPAAVEFDCDDSSKPFTAVFYTQLEPQAVVLTYGDDQTIAMAQPAASGSKYGAEGVEFWEHQGEATVKWFGAELSCQAVQ
ncbi:MULTISPECIES: MliC family protein [Pseudomonas]|uniref:MliC family protein n=1 Tax=Pseudomonas sp. Hg7Tf TaxID=3236988 RepID=A0AB39I0X2_9PSED|nr:MULTISPECIES: MliC family protein [Pseudomonas]KJK06031.1 lipoprotein [Pseudomonas sp. 5]MDD1978228.1 MliC family protein [Pseudomonas putida]MDH2559911.1 MliC family protein [Pseudomonas sp. Hg5Tf]